MSDITISIITASLTIAGAVTIFLITKIIEELYLKPYVKFKEDLIKTKTFINFNDNILTNQFWKKEVSTDFQQRVINIKQEARKIWSKLDSSYENCFKIFLKNKIPNKKEIVELNGNLIYFSNALVIRNENSKERNNDVLKRNEMVNKCKKIINKYLRK